MSLKTAVRALALAASLSALAHAQPQAPTTPAAPTLTVPAGTYALEKTHASLTFRVLHLGLSRYTARFATFDASLRLDPANPANSSVTATIDPASVRTDYAGDYAASHGATYTGWDDDLARNPRFFNTAQFPQASFRSTRVELTGPNTGKVTGDLTFLGQTRPVTLDVTFNGQLASHPFARVPAVGFSARGTFSRSAFGMTHLVPAAGRPGGVGDEVELLIEAEFLRTGPAN